MLICSYSYAEDSEEDEENVEGPSTVTILPAIDTSGLNISQPLQQTLGQLFFQTGKFRVQFSSYSLSGFTEADLSQTFARLDTDQVAFAYLESGRVSLFIFDVTRPREFIVVSLSFQPLQSGGEQAYQIVQYNLQSAFEQLYYFFTEEQFQPLPGLKEEDVKELAEQEAGEQLAQKAAVTKRLFLEFAVSQKTKLYLGASLGTARFAAGGDASSSPNLGLQLGYKFGEASSVEFGADAFSYLIAHLSYRHHLPILPEKYVSLSASLGAGMVLKTLTENLGFDRTNISGGGILIGPGIGVDIPLLGAQVRGEVRFLIGSGSILLGSYGLTYSL